MQAATFVLGLNNFHQFDDRKLSNRIRVFILLLHRSMSRESLKGQAHLDIDLLVDLIDRFHIHDATDPRDKIYALWGLSSDSVSIEALKPDYEKSWEDLMKELGKFVFGENAVLWTSKKQMIYARSHCCGLGKVERVSTENISNMKQELTITSMRAFTYLDYGYAWSRVIEINGSAEEIQKSDIVLYIPGVKRLVIARPQNYYLRIISVVDSRQVRILTPSHEVSEQYWTSWQPFLESMETPTNEVPLLWSWEKDQESEDREALRLIESHYSASTVQASNGSAHTYFEAEALSDMALLFMVWDDYQLACDRLGAIFNIHSSDHGSESEIHLVARDRLYHVTERQNLYRKAKGFLTERALTDKREDLFKAKVVGRCARVLLHAGIGIAIGPVPNDQVITYVCFLLQSQLETQNMDTEVWIDLASKIMSRGVNKKLLLDAVHLCTLEWRHFCNSLYEPEMQERLPFNIEEADEAVRGVTLAHNNDYLRFLLQIAGDDLLLSSNELLTISHANIDAWSFNQLIKHCEAPITNFANILQTVVELRHRIYGLGGKYLKKILEGNADRISVTSDAILVVCQWDIDAVSALLRITDNPRSLITASALNTAIINHGITTVEIIELLAQYADTEWRVSEDALLALATSKDIQNRSLIFIALLEHDNITVSVTQRVLWTLLREMNEITLLLRFRPDLPIDDMKITYRHEDHYSIEQIQWSTSNLAQLQTAAEVFHPGTMSEMIPVTEWTGYAHLLNLLRYRRNELSITKGLVTKTVLTYPIVEYKSYVPDPYVRYELAMCQSHHDLHHEIDKYTSLLIRHADDDVILALLGSPLLLDTAAERGYSRVIDSLRLRSKSPALDLETYFYLAVFGQFIRNQNRYPPMDDNSTIGDDVLMRREVMPMPSKLLQILLIHVLNLQHDGSRCVLLKKVLARTIEPRISPKYQGELVDVIMGREGDRTFLEVLFKHGVVGVDVLPLEMKDETHTREHSAVWQRHQNLG